MSRGGCLGLSLCLLIGSLFVIAPPTSAIHWCSPLTIAVTPQSGGTGEVVTIVVSLTNGISETVTVSSILVRFGWTSTAYNFGSVTLAGGASAQRIGSVQLPSSAGDYQMTITVTGQAPSDFFPEPCTATGTFRVTASLLPYLVVGGIVVAAVVVVAVVLSRRKATIPVVPPAAIPPPSQVPSCPVCGQSLAWVAPSNRWYCARCGQFR